MSARKRYLESSTWWVSSLPFLQACCIISNSQASSGMTANWEDQLLRCNGHRLKYVLLIKKNSLILRGVRQRSRLPVRLSRLHLHRASKLPGKYAEKLDLMPELGLSGAREGVRDFLWPSPSGSLFHPVVRSKEISR